MFFELDFFWKKVKNLSEKDFKKEILEIIFDCKKERKKNTMGITKMFPKIDQKRASKSVILNKIKEVGKAPLNSEIGSIANKKVVNS